MALVAFTNIYEKANQHDVRSWKAKSLIQLLDMYTMMKKNNEVKLTLNNIIQMNKNDRLG
jgi:hypothetical protein